MRPTKQRSNTVRLGIALTLIMLTCSGIRADDPPATTQPATSPTDANRVKAHQDRQPRGLEGVGLSAEQVNQAIEHGRDFLWEHLKAQLAKENRHLGDDTGYDVLQALALVHAGAHLKYKE